MGFGRVTKYWRISLDDIKRTPLINGVESANPHHIENEASADDIHSMANTNENMLVQAWDDAVEFASGKYRYENHNLIANNCHAHVSTSLNRLHFRDITYWNTVLLMLYLVIYGKYVRYGHFAHLDTQ